MWFWIVAAAVVVIGFAVAWVTSGRMGPGGPTDRHDGRFDEARAQSYRNNLGNPPGSGGGPTSF